jgi:two-component system, NarL family, response regulator DevR
VLDLIAEGLSKGQIGERMFLAEKTVKNYVMKSVEQAHATAHPGRRVRRRDAQKTDRPPRLSVTGDLLELRVR